MSGRVHGSVPHICERMDEVGINPSNWVERCLCVKSGTNRSGVPHICEKMDEVGIKSFHPPNSVDRGGLRIVCRALGPIVMYLIYEKRCRMRFDSLLRHQAGRKGVSDVFVCRLGWVEGNVGLYARLRPERVVTVCVLKP